MALDNYANLKEAIETWSHRYDISLHADDCVTLAEQWMYKGLTPLMTPENMTTDTTVVTTQDSALPSGLIQFTDIRISVDGEYHRMKFKPISDLPLCSTDGTPIYYTVSGTLSFDRTPDKSYTLRRVYYSAPTALSDDNPVNSMLTNYPHIYLAGAVASALTYAKEDDLAAQWEAKFTTAVMHANARAQNTQLGANPEVSHWGCIP
jgi:hypothetical protein